MFIVFDAIVRQQLYVEQLKNGRSRNLNSVFGDLAMDLRKALSIEHFDNLGELNKKALKDLVRRMREILRLRVDPYLAADLQWLEYFMKEDKKTFVSIYKPFAEEVEAPEDSKLWGALMLLPMAANGVLPGIFLRNYGLNIYLTIEREVMKAAANKASKADLVAAITGTRAAQYRDGALNRLFQAGNAVNDTIIQHITGQTNAAVARSAFAMYEWVSILDGATTHICRSRNGLRWAYGAGPLPPAHIRCRSSVVPVIDGQPTPPHTFGEWAKSQPSEVIKDIFGTEAPPKDFKTTKTLTIEEFGAKRSLILTP